MRQIEERFIEENIDLFACPTCGGSMKLQQAELVCRSCGKVRTSCDNIFQLFEPHETMSESGDVTERMKSFYEENPFPNYDDFDDVAALIAKSRRGVFAKLLDEQIPFGARVLECGCGTGQLSNFLSIANRTVIGADLCLNSLRLAQGFKERQDLEDSFFVQMNLLRPCFQPQSFDLVVSNGVLMTTNDPARAFATIASLVKPNGYIMIGLYHKYGRLATDLRRLIFRMTGDRLKFLDSRVVKKGMAKDKRHAWFMDQYKNPHESKHTVTEMLGWLKDTGFDFVRSIPSTIPFQTFDDSTQLFSEDVLGNRLQRLAVDVGMTFTGAQEGGFFIVLAKKCASSGESDNAQRPQFAEDQAR